MARRSSSATPWAPGRGAGGRRAARPRGRPGAGRTLRPQRRDGRGAAAAPPGGHGPAVGGGRRGSRTCPSSTPGGARRTSTSTAPAWWRASAGPDTPRRSRAPPAPSTTRPRRGWPRSPTPTLVVMGELDPDFPDPAAEAEWIADGAARRGGHGARGRALPPVPAARRDRRRRAALPRRGGTPVPRAGLNRGPGRRRRRRGWPTRSGCRS